MGLSANVPRSMWFLFSYFILLSFESVESSATGGNATHFFKWKVENMHWNPDGLEGVVMGINGKFPGPTIRARARDTVHIELTNGLTTEGVVIHWHGIRQIGTPWADGTASISQCPINPGETFSYRFQVDKPGTYFYHGHYGMQRSAGLYGMLIVDVAEGEKEILQYDVELHVLLSDWWHESTHKQEVDLSSRPIRWIGEPQTLLINGRGQYNCSLAAHVSNTSACLLTGGEQYAPDILRVEPNKTYRLRIASTTSLASLNFAVGSHKLVVVEADGNYVQHFTANSLYIYSGETYSVLLTTDQNPAQNYWASLSVIGREPRTPPALTILNYLPNPAQNLPPTGPTTPPRWNDYDSAKSFAKKILALRGSPAPPRRQHKRMYLLNTQNLVDGLTKWAINNVSLVLPPTPYLGSIRYGLKRAFDQRTPPNGFSPNYDIKRPPPNPNATMGSGIYALKFNTTVDVVLQNANVLREGVSEVHPWHLHGHDFWVVGYGEGRFRDEDERRFNLRDAPSRNTAVLFPYGWTALRFVADNPGVWAFHCHIEAHLHMGMGVVLAEGVRRVGWIPKAAMGCGLTGKMLMGGDDGRP